MAARAKAPLPAGLWPKAPPVEEDNTTPTANAPIATVVVKDESTAIAGEPLSPPTNGHAGEKVRAEFAALAEAANKHDALVKAVQQHVDDVWFLCQEEGLSAREWRTVMNRKIGELRSLLPKSKAVH